MAIPSPHMGLTIWNLTTDPYDHAQLADNFAKIDAHRHADGEGQQIPTGGIEDGAVTAVKIAPGVIPSTLTLDDGAVTTPKILDSSVTTAKINNLAVTNGKIDAGAVSNSKIANSAVDTSKLQTDSVDETILKDDATAGSPAAAVTANHIRDGVVSLNKLSSTVGEQTGATTNGVKRRGTFANAGAETSSASAGSYDLMPTPDRVSSLIVPSTGGLVFVLYRALFKITSASNDWKAALFIGGNRPNTTFGNIASAPFEQTLGPVCDNWSPLFTTTGYDVTGFGSSLGIGQSTTTNSTVDDANPQTWGGSGGSNITAWHPVVFEVPGGTYNVSVQFQKPVTGGGTFELKNRKLYAWTVGF